MENNSLTPLGSVLVTGGCGFVGFHIVRYFLFAPTCTSVSVVSRNPTTNLLPGVSYHAGDISDSIAMRALINQVKPKVIIHSACPSAVSASAATYEAITIKGTRNLLAIASEAPSVKVLIYTSTATMAAGAAHRDLDESTTLADTDPKAPAYARAKALADKMVLAANDPPRLLTATIRLPLVYGERDLLAIPATLAALEKGQTNFQVGGNKNLYDFVSVDNSAAAHVLLAKSLLAQVNRERDDPALPKVDGEAFNITDGPEGRHYFWDYPRLVWHAASEDLKGTEGIEPYTFNAQKTWVIPTWLALLLADALEWIYWLFTLGTKRPYHFGRQQVEYFCFERTYSITKARRRLGYVPRGDWEEGVRKAVRWNLEEGGGGKRLRGRGVKKMR
ncbi:MAG: erg26, C-3 sterol dehydrogenase [Icmadophila ericetorum]|nr:erg26, C-3 sterol dehydrogenase [Icmadophila ericetorum]